MNMGDIPMTKTIIPDAALLQHLIALGKTGAGKSSTMRLLVERLLDLERPVTIIDPKGDWYGLRSAADGEHAGYPVVIFGGEHALSKAQIAARAGYEPDGGGFNNALGKLRSLELIRGRGEIKASEDLF